MTVALSWHADALAQFHAISKSHHAWLMTGADGHGAEHFVRAAAAAQLCDTPTTQGLACGACESCTWLQAGSHPDWREISPEEAEEGDETLKRQEIKLPAIRSLADWAVSTAHRRRKVVIVQPANAMNANAANALLKLLEEPPRAVTFLLFASDKRRLPATIASRCAAFALPSATRKQAADWLTSTHNQDRAQIDSLLAQAGGAPLIAASLNESDIQVSRRAFLDALSQPAALSALAQGDLLETISRVARRDALAARLQWLARWVHDLSCVHAGGEPRFNPDYNTELHRLSKTLPTVATIRYYSNIIERLRWVQHPLNARLVLEDVLLQYKRMLAVVA
jgi:DNA polymerase III subunit delta'